MVNLHLHDNPFDFFYITSTSLFLLASKTLNGIRTLNCQYLLKYIEKSRRICLSDDLLITIIKCNLILLGKIIKLYFKKQVLGNYLFIYLSIRVTSLTGGNRQKSQCGCERFTLVNNRTIRHNGQTEG